MPIVPAHVTDVAAIEALVNSAYRGETAKQGWTTESHLLDGIRIDEEELQSYFSKPEVTILKYLDDEGTIIGCAYLEITKEQKTYLGMLTVKPALQSGGIGKQLLAAAQSFAEQQGSKAIKISVITSRHELISWYERQGYRATGKLLPFPTQTKFGIPKVPIELMVMEKPVLL